MALLQSSRPLWTPAKPSFQATPSTHRYCRFAWTGLGYTVFVILFGAVVRVTGSGAGCGQHWPTCHGQVAHLPDNLATGIELTHRLTSGAALVVAIALFAWARKIFPVGHLSRRAAFWVLGFMLLECLIGAVLVLNSLVATDASLARAIIMPIHLASASCLAAAFAISAWGSRFRAPLGMIVGAPQLLLGLSLAAILAVSMTGALTALGDTLFPLSSVVAGSAQGTPTISGESSHFLQQLRALHPVLAVLLSAFVLWVLARSEAGALSPEARWYVKATRRSVLAALGLGAANVLLAAPAWMQIVHLAGAMAVWLLLVLTTANLVLAPRSRT